MIHNVWLSLMNRVLMFKVWTKLQKLAYQTKKLKKDCSLVDKKLKLLREKLQEV